MKNIWFLLLFTGICLGCVEKYSNESEEDIDIIAEYEKRFYNPHRAEFIEWMKTHPESLDMDLSEQAELADVQIEESTDGNVRVYSWISGGGTSPDWTNFTQYRDSKGHVRIIDGLPMQYEAGGGTITSIIYAGILNGKKAYFFDYYSKASSQEGYNSLYPSVMKADTFALDPASFVMVKCRNLWDFHILFLIGIFVPMARVGNKCFISTKTQKGCLL